MGRRKYPRAQMSLPARVWKNSTLAPAQDCVTSDVTPNGVCVSGLGAVRAGEVVTLGYHRKSCRFRVVWVGGPTGPRRGMVGLENLEPEKLIFGLGLPSSAPDNYVAPLSQVTGESRGAMAQAPGAERRKDQRHSCALGTEVRSAGAAFCTWATVSDIGMGGCYVQIMSPFALETHVELVLRTQELRIALKGTVVTTHPGIGMGIKFTHVRDDTRRQLSALVDSLAASIPQLGPVNAPLDKPEPEREYDASSALQTLLTSFAEKHVLTRQEFLELLEQSRKRSESANETERCCR